MKTVHSICARTWTTNPDLIVHILEQNTTAVKKNQKQKPYQKKTPSKTSEIIRHT